jgi:hypothetical protein
VHCAVKTPLRVAFRREPGSGPSIFLWFGGFFWFFCGVKKGGRHHRKIILAEYVQIDLRELTQAR